MTTKCDVTVGRQMTLNTGNYTSIRPSIGITLKDIDVGNIGDANNRLMLLLNMYLTREIAILQEFKNEVDEAGGPKRFIENIDKENMDKAIEEAEKNLGEITSWESF